MCDWFTFHVDQDAKMVVIDIQTQILLETQPYDSEEADELCADTLIPMIDKLRDVCIEKGYTQTCIVNLKDVDVLLMSPSVIVRILCNIWEHTKDEPENLINNFSVINSNTIFRGIYRVTKKVLPTYLTNLITIS
jgi:hypothetical protein